MRRCPKRSMATPIMTKSSVQPIFPNIHSMGAFDVLTIGTLALLEGILSVDNAIVLALLVRGLPKKQQRKALTYGMAGAVGFRVLAILSASWLMQTGPVQLLGGF